MTLLTADSVNGLASSLTANTVHALSSVTSTALSFLPPSVNRFFQSLFSSTQQLLAERWEYRAIAICAMLPTTFFILFCTSIAVAILWPFTFLAATIGGLAITANYLFWPLTVEWKTCLFSLIFSVGSQLLLVLPVYFLSPFALFVLLIASVAYTFATGSWMMLAVTVWWLITTPYWSIIHFITFPFLFVATLAFQVCLAVVAFVACMFYPTLPAECARYYNTVMEQRLQNKQTRNTYTSSHYTKETNRGDYIEDQTHVKEESKTQ